MEARHLAATLEAELVVELSGVIETEDMLGLAGEVLHPQDHKSVLDVSGNWARTGPASSPRSSSSCASSETSWGIGDGERGGELGSRGIWVGVSGTTRKWWRLGFGKV